MYNSIYSNLDQMHYYFVPFVGSAAGLVNPQMNYQHQFQTYFNYFLQQYQQQQLCSHGCHWVFDGVYWYLAPLQDGLRNLFFRQNNHDFQLWQRAQSAATGSVNVKKLGDALATHGHDVKNFFSRVLDILDKRLTDQDGEVKDIKEKLKEISSRLSSVESQAKKIKISFPWITAIPASSLSKEPSSTTTSPKEPSTPSSTPDVSVSGLSEEDRQWQFLYKVAQKLFNSLRGKGKEQKSDVIAWLKDKFSGSLENEDDKWENFKSLCEAQKSKETQDGNLDPYMAFCSLESAELEDSNERKYSSAKSSFSWWISFNKKYPNANPIDKFDEWYSSDDPAAQGLNTHITQST